jgi:bifunctional non-homologous end joining protein LigD
MKAQLVESRPPGDWIYEIKFDGYRALALRGGSEPRVLSRNQNDLGKKFTNIRDSIAALDVQDAIIDYAVCGIALTERLSPWTKKDGRAFNCSKASTWDRNDRQSFSTHLIFSGSTPRTFKNLPIEERKAKLEELLKKPPGLIRYSVSFTKDIKELLGRAQKLGLEGLIGKRAGSRYEAGKRSGAWVKLN